MISFVAPPLLAGSCANEDGTLLLSVVGTVIHVDTLF
jgi:hypothetical protein